MWLNAEHQYKMLLKKVISSLIHSDTIPWLFKMTFKINQREKKVSLSCTVKICHLTVSSTFQYNTKPHSSDSSSSIFSAAIHLFFSHCFGFHYYRCWDSLSTALGKAQMSLEQCDRARNATATSSPHPSTPRPSSLQPTCFSQPLVSDCLVVVEPLPEVLPCLSQLPPTPPAHRFKSSKAHRNKMKTNNLVSVLLNNLFIISLGGSFTDLAKQSTAPL